MASTTLPVVMKARSVAGWTAGGQDSAPIPLWKLVSVTRKGEMAILNWEIVSLPLERFSMALNPLAPCLLTGAVSLSQALAASCIVNGGPVGVGLTEGAGVSPEQESARLVLSVEGKILVETEGVGRGLSEAVLPGVD